MFDFVSTAAVFQSRTMVQEDVNHSSTETVGHSEVAFWGHPNFMR